MNKLQNETKTLISEIANTTTDTVSGETIYKNKKLVFIDCPGFDYSYFDRKNHTFP